MIDAKLLAKYGLPKDFSPKHPDYNIPSKKNGYLLALKESDPYGAVVGGGTAIVSYKEHTLQCMTICSSHERPVECARMLESFHKTKQTIQDIFVYVDEKDSNVAEYRSILSGVKHEIGPHRYMCDVLNQGALKWFPGLRYYHEVNDDHVFITPGWCSKMIEAIERRGGTGIAYGQTENLPTSIMISGNLVRLLGYWFYPKFRHTCCDFFLDDLARSTDIYAYVPDVLIEHRHFVFGKAKEDETYRWVYSSEQQQYGTAAYDEWKLKNRDRDINLIIEEKKKPRLLSICTSFRRPKMLKDMLASFYATKSPGTDILIYLHIDDPFLEEYKEYIDQYPHIFGPHTTLQEVINHVVFETNREVPYYQVICDDHIYRTQKWDSLLIAAIEKQANGWGFACGRDLINGDDWKSWQHPSAEIWSWKMAHTLGYVYPKEFKHQGLDFYTKDLALAIDSLTFVPEVVIEHLWYGGCNKPMDDNIKEKYNPEAMKQADEAFEHWKKTGKQIAIEAINAARAKEAV
jgi:hypothetical protein